MGPKSFIANLQIRVMLLFFLVALAPLGMVAVFSLQTAQELIMNLVSNQLENVANDKAALLEKWLLERKADLQVVAGSAMIRSMDPGRIGPYLQLVGTHYQVYRRFLVKGRDQRVVFDSLGRLSGDAGEEWYQPDRAGEFYLSGMVLDSEHKESVFQVVAPVKGEDGEDKGAVCATVGTSAIVSVILKVSLGETGECYLVDKEGRFLAHQDPRRILAENIAQSESFKNIFGAGERRRIYTDYRGIEVLGTSRRVAGTDWYLVVEQDRDEAFKSADRLRRTVYLVVAFSVAGAVLLAGLLAYYVVNPIRALSEAANTLARGEFDQAAVTTNRADEIGTLYRAFTGMAEKLEAQQRRLEEKVDLQKAELRESDVQLQRTRLAAARSEQLAALGRLGAGVTHEIRTPLAALKLFLESARSELEVSPEFETDFEIALKQIQRIEATINRFLDFAKPQDPIFSTIEVGQLIEDALLVVRPKANQQEIAVKVAVDPGLAKVRGDRKQLGEALLNLMVNALEAMPGRGQLRVAALGEQWPNGKESRRGVRIEVSDTGGGIAQENFANLFDPFFTTKASGTGLGLSIVQSTVLKHGGSVRVESVVGQGTTFSILLPGLAEPGMETDGKDFTG